MTRTILIIEDDEAIRIGLTDNLRFEGYQVLIADNGDDGLKMIEEQCPDLVLLDLNIPKLDGLSLCTQLRAKQNHCPVIMLTAKGEVADKVAGFESGADDYVSKPFSVRELLARIKVRLQKNNAVPLLAIDNRVGVNLIDLQGCCLVKKDKRIPLTQSETQILQILLEQKGQVVSRNVFIDEIEQGRRFSNTRTLDNCMVKLRQKIEPDPANPVHIRTIHGMGYQLIA